VSNFDLLELTGCMAGELSAQLDITIEPTINAWAIAALFFLERIYAPTQSLCGATQRMRRHVKQTIANFGMGLWSHRNAVLRTRAGARLS
jgi:hypothetical protein